MYLKSDLKLDEKINTLEKKCVNFISTLKLIDIRLIDFQLEYFPIEPTFKAALQILENKGLIVNFQHAKEVSKDWLTHFSKSS